MLIILLIILLFFFYYFYKYSLYTINNKLNLKYYKNEKTGYISVIILNYIRPHNLDRLLPYINKHSLINEIIVLHGNPIYYKNYKYKKVKNYKDYENNKLYGGARRFKGISYAKNNLIMFLDDDTIPTFKLIDNLYNTLTNNYNSNTIYGPIERICDKKGYLSYTYKNNNRTPVILTPCILTKKNVIEDFNEYYFNYFKEWFIKYKGNCEDLSLNLFIYKFYKEKPVIVEGELIELDIKNGYSSKSNHLQIRNNFCKKYFNKINYK
jgi:hypothetical protein